MPEAKEAAKSARTASFRCEEEVVAKLRTICSVKTNPATGKRYTMLELATEYVQNGIAGDWDEVVAAIGAQK